MKRGVLFPGQGAQFAGMGRDWCDAYPSAAAIWREASTILGFSLEQQCWHENDQVNRTDIAQPGILVTSVAAIQVAMEREPTLREASLCAGLSLGEYSALWFAGSLDFADAVRLVRLRGEAMQRASEAIPSGMVALMGASEAQAQALAGFAARSGICSVANLNAPGQVIVSGELRALDDLEASAKDHGVRRTKRLVVAGGFHSECMRPAAEALRSALKSVAIRPPRTPFITNVTGEFTSDPESIREHLSNQVCAPVLWEKSMRTALARGVRDYLEPAPGKTLAGLLAKIDENARTHSLAAPADLASASLAP